jgi:hypothetical protein
MGSEQQLWVKPVGCKLTADVARLSSERDSVQQLLCVNVNVAEERQLAASCLAYWC